MNKQNALASPSKKSVIRGRAKQATLSGRCSRSKPAEALGPPLLDSVEGGVLDPSLHSVVVRIRPYAGMSCGDRVVLSWSGFDMEGLPYRYETSRYVSEAQLGTEVVFVVKNTHIAALDGGSLEVCWTLTSVVRPTPVTSARLHLEVGDVHYSLLSPVVDDAVGGNLDPGRVANGTTITLRPYARMAAGDWISLVWESSSANAPHEDRLLVEPFAVGQALVFGVAPELIMAHVGSEVVIRYRVQQRSGVVRESGITRVMIAPLTRGVLSAPQVLEAADGVLDAQHTIGGITIVISDAQAEEGELVYLKCDGENYSHREDRDITLAMAMQPLVFSVPQEFWQEHLNTVVRLSYSVERLDDVSQRSGVTVLRIQG